MALPPNSTKPRGIVVFSGGSAANSLVDVFKTLTEHKKCPLSYVIPISDNGGSSSELIRVFGGPGIGDLRSRLVRLIPDDPNNTDTERAAIRAFFNHRLPKDADSARSEWLEIVEARHPLWNHISSAKQELIRSFLNFLNLELVKRIRPSSVFNFSSASIGNLFITGARLFSGSLESSIYLLSSICLCPSSTSVLPAINTNFSHHISASLTDGTIITGQNNISHPSNPTALPTSSSDSLTETDYHDRIEDANPPGSLPTLRKPYITFSKAPLISRNATPNPDDSQPEPEPEADHELSARIARIWYINPYGHEIRPHANPAVLSTLADSQTVIYSIGSLYTSIIPSLILRGIGDTLATTATIRNKILILNSSIDRETGPASNPMTATDFVAAIANAVAGSRVHGVTDSIPRSEYKVYVTHVVCLEGEGTPKVDRTELAALGIETVRLYGRRTTGGEEENFLRYDETALVQALEAVVGRREAKVDRSRRNTLDG